MKVLFPSQVHFGQVRMRLFILFGSGTIVALAVTAIAAGMQKYGAENTPRAFGWLLPCCIPTMTLLVGSYVADMGSSPQAKPRVVPGELANVTQVLAFVYVTFWMCTVLAQDGMKMGPLAWLQLSHLWLGPLQGLVDAPLGALFMKRVVAQAAGTGVQVPGGRGGGGTAVVARADGGGAGVIALHQADERDDG